jgi:hypothetical protein
MKRIDVLPDDVLLEIFDFIANTPIVRYPKRKRDVEARWLWLAHVCRQWRNLVFASPRRLNLQLFCRPETPVKDRLDVWPALPLIVTGGEPFTPFSCTDNVIAALGHSNRIREVNLGLENWQLEQVSAAMQVPFPELTKLMLSESSRGGHGGETIPLAVIPDLFLGGSAPRLESFGLLGIPYPRLPNLLLSATQLVHLSLHNIPHSGYISPEAMVASLSALSRLGMLTLEFKSPLSLPDRETRHPPPPKRSILPVLHDFFFKGKTEYLEDLVSRVDTPELENLFIEFFNPTDLDLPLLAQFFDRTPTFKAPDEASVQIDDWSTGVLFGIFRIFIKCEPDQQLSSVGHVCSTSFSSTVETVEDLYIERRYSQLDWRNYAIENTLWLELLLPFTAVKNLYLYKDFTPGIAGALQGLVEDGITDVLPNLQNIFVDELAREQFEKNIGQFVVARRLSGYPVAISNWDKDTSDEDKDPSDWDEDSSDSDVGWM